MGACVSALVLDDEGAPRCRLTRKYSSPSSEVGPCNSKLRSNGASKSCCAYSKQGRKGINQDSFLVWEDFGSQGEATYCGVFDGHGPLGHLVAKEVRDYLPNLLLDDKSTCLFMSNASLDLLTGSEDVNSNLDNLVSLQKAIIDCHSRMDDKLKTNSEFNCECSGTTAVSLLVKDKDLMIANVGDSRAILVSRGPACSLQVEQLTVDFKPDLPGELERIRNCRGRVFALRDEPDVARMWMPDENKPGLAMTRALGDFCLKEYGLSAVPHVLHRGIMEDDEFVVLATDGVWDVMSNEEVASVVSNAEPKGLAAKIVVDMAVKRWKQKLSYVRRDDCAVVCHFLNQKHTMGLSSMPSSDSNSSSSSGGESVNLTIVSQNTGNLVMPCFDRGI